jgi:hypothetical protein
LRAFIGFVFGPAEQEIGELQWTEQTIVHSSDLPYHSCWSKEFRVATSEFSTACEASVKAFEALVASAKEAARKLGTRPCSEFPADARYYAASLFVHRQRP